jgi:hypothetical protein
VKEPQQKSAKRETEKCRQPATARERESTPSASWPTQLGVGWPGVEREGESSAARGSDNHKANRRRVNSTPDHNLLTTLAWGGGCIGLTVLPHCSSFVVLLTLHHTPHESHQAEVGPNLFPLALPQE